MSRTDVAPAEPGPAPDHPRTAMSVGNRTAMRIVLAVIGVLVTLGSLVSLGVVAVALGSTRIVSDTQALPANMRALAIDTGDVPVVVHVITDADAREARVDLRMVTRGDTKLAVADNAEDGRVTLSDNGSGFLWFNRTGELTVILPPEIARELNVTVNEQARSLANEASLDQSSSPRPTAT